MSLTKRIAASIDRDPIILSHHPLCGKFEDHMFMVRGRHVCIGCTTVYPSAAVMVAALFLIGIDSFSILTAAALALFAANLVRFVIHDRLVRIACNIFLGASVGAALFSAVYSPEDLKLVVIAAGLAVAVGFSYLKGRRVFTTCRACESYGNFPSCGFPSVPRAGATLNKTE